LGEVFYTDPLKLLDVTEDEWAIRVACAQVIAADREDEKKKREAKTSRTY
tara:strand:- start:356 stop:505 length:150 start_codon:yes stop_codon:yes gene_type:complete